MSLIADALRRAQEQRAQGKPGKDDDDRARRMLSGPRTLRVDADADRGVPRSVMIAGTVLAAALITFGGVVWLAPSADDGSAVVAANPSNPSNPVEQPVGGDVAGGSRASGAAEGVEPPAGTGVVVVGAGTEGTEERRGAEGAEDAEPGPVAGTGTRTGTGAPVAPVPAVPVGETPSFTLRLQGQEAPRSMDASALFGRALGAQQAGDLQGAASLYRRAIEQNPTDAQLYNNLGTVYRRLSMPGEAAGAFRRATEVDPGYAPAWSNLGIMLDGLGRDEEAIAAFRAALRQDPSNNGARVNLANKYIGMGLTDDAVTLLNDALHDDPALPEAHYALARARETAGDTAQAIRHYRVFLQLADGRFPALESRVVGHLAELEGGGE